MAAIDEVNLKDENNHMFAVNVNPTRGIKFSYLKTEEFSSGTKSSSDEEKVIAANSRIDLGQIDFYKGGDIDVHVMFSSKSAEYIN
jgi:hypothetical protein